ncbi:hypothetical protein BS47DRAFT_1392449 [Hydnum rufescens UP504]|uniref:Allantoin permease n=1 Tax=Hydnum rufescens UP504 TaxID=1448309 RepID=A0A9P6B020_9AGAM|nr:hypothetical protein BS47DRAFT_1392449 [Hydnum rufescens UP504]
MGRFRVNFEGMTSLKAWELHPEPSTLATNPNYSNKDMDPTPPDQRVWSMFSYISLWISDAFNTASWELASASISLGLGWRQSLEAIAIGHILIALVITANGVIGARLHVPFPVLNRSSFGFWFSYFTVISRAVLAMFWFAIQTFTGSECVYQMIKAIWPSFAHLPNHIPASSNITSAGLLSYFIFWLIQFPFLLVSPQRIRWLFLVKATIVPPTFLAMMIWAFAKTGGGPLLNQPSAIQGSLQSWAWLNTMNSALGNYATMSVNIPDFTRYARRPRDTVVQLIIIPIFFTFTAFIGIAVTSAGNILYGSYIWDPLRLIDKWDNRAAHSLLRSLSLWPPLEPTFLQTLSLLRMISRLWLRRSGDPAPALSSWSQIICAIIGGWAICPWEILAHAIGFLSFMSGYTIVLSPIAAVMIVDYWLVKRGNVDIPALYRPEGRYRYWYGTNWRAALALFVTIPLGLPGLINFVIAAVLYYLTSTLFPATEASVSHTIYGNDDDRESVEDRVSGEEEKKMAV